LLNRIRHENRALQTHLNLTFLNAFNDAIMWYEKATPDRSNVVLVAVSLDPHNPQSCDCEAPLWRWVLPDDAALHMEELMTGESSVWRGKPQRLSLTPGRPFMIWRARPLV
jgi:starch synthase (maltosyl-transferring)